MKTMLINGYDLKCTCDAFPEQYDVLKDNSIVGYLRLRNGYFTVQIPDERGEVIYEAYPKGNSAFLDNEREMYLKLAIKAIETIKPNNKYHTITDKELNDIFNEKIDFSNVKIESYGYLGPRFVCSNTFEMVLKENKDKWIR